jgi:hypothetical protein
MTTMPSIFAAHGAPVLLDDGEWMAQLAAWAAAMPRPRSILMVSAHWEDRPATLGATRTVPLVDVSFPVTGFWMEGAFTRRSVQFDAGRVSDGGGA